MKKARFFVFLVSILLLSSCGGLKNQSSIHVKDSIGGDNFSIKINVKRAANTSPSMNFSIDKSIEELANEITKIDSSLSTIIWQDKFISVGTDSNLFLLEQIEKLDEDKENEDRYSFFAPIGTFEINAPSDKYIDMYIPYHLIKGLANIQHWPDYENAYPKTMVCEAFGTIDDFFNFYSKFEQCEVEKETDSLIVTNKKNGYKMELHFSQNENLLTVAFDIMKDETS